MKMSGPNTRHLHLRPCKNDFSHCRHGAAGKGKGIKALDIVGAYACTAC